MMKPQKCTANTDNKIDVTTIIENLNQWLIEHSEKCQYLLAHADDGVIWGRFDKKDGKTILVTSHEAFSNQLPALNISTLQQCRIFGPKAETMVWRDDAGWHARNITDKQSDDEQALDEEQMLWGTGGETSDNGFTLTHDGSEGLQHAVPIVIPTEKFNPRKMVRPLRLTVRHYITYDEYGMARIYLSRLVDITCKEQKS